MWQRTRFASLIISSPVLTPKVPSHMYVHIVTQKDNVVFVGIEGALHALSITAGKISTTSTHMTCQVAHSQADSFVLTFTQLHTRTGRPSECCGSQQQWRCCVHWRV